MGWDWGFSLMPYGDWWRRHRRGFYKYFNSDSSDKYKDDQEQQLLKFLRALLVCPQDFMNLVRL